MMMPRRLLFGLAATLAALGTAGAVGAKPLVHAIPADIASLDPADIRGQQDQEIGTNVYERLVKMKFNARPDGTLMADPVEVVPELAESWTVEALARFAGVSRSVMAERFAEVVGQPPMQYLAMWRMQLASRLLSEGAQVAAVAAAVGYESEAAFSRAFKKLVGQAPTTWRRGVLPAPTSVEGPGPA